MADAYIMTMKRRSSLFGERKFSIVVVVVKLLPHRRTSLLYRLSCNPWTLDHWFARPIFYVIRPASSPSSRLFNMRRK